MLFLLLTNFIILSKFSGYHSNTTWITTSHLYFIFTFHYYNFSSVLIQKRYTSTSTILQLYFSFINPYLDYNLLNWSSAPPSNMDCPRLSTKKAIRTILSKSKQEHALPFFKTINILPLDELIKQKSGTYMWKLENNRPHPHIFRLLVSTQQFNYNKSNSHINIFYPRLEYAKRHIIYGVKVLHRLIFRFFEGFHFFGKNQ